MQEAEDRSWFFLGLLEDGFPALSDAFIALGALSMEQLVVHDNNWPVKSRTCHPLTSSRRSQQLKCGKPHYEVNSIPLHLCKMTPCQKCTDCLHIVYIGHAKMCKMVSVSKCAKWLHVQNAQIVFMSHQIFIIILSRLMKHASLSALPLTTFLKIVILSSKICLSDSHVMLPRLHWKYTLMTSKTLSIPLYNCSSNLSSLEMIVLPKEIPRNGWLLFLTGPMNHFHFHTCQVFFQAFYRLLLTRHLALSNSLPPTLAGNPSPFLLTWYSNNVMDSRPSANPLS